jgi:hypothetical protein
MNPIVRVLGLVGLGMMAGGCATIANGTTQAINIDSEPAGAECTLLRGGQQLSNVTTPSPVTVKRDQQTIHVRCKKEGYEETLVVMNSRYETASAGNILLGGVIGMMVDNSSGANAKYDAYVMVRLPPLSATDQIAAASRPKQPPAETPPVQQAAVAPAAAPATAIPSAVMASSSVPPGPFDGRYSGGAFGGGISLRDLEITVTSGNGLGTVRAARCPNAGEIKLTIDSAGLATGTGDLLSGDACIARPATFEGRAQGGRLLLNVRYDGRTSEITLTRSDATPVAAVIAPGPFDGRYTGGLQLSGRTYTGWTFGGNATLRTLDVGVTGGVGTGTARYSQCPQPGEITLTISPAGVVSGTGNLVSGDSCTALPVTFEGRAQAGLLALTVRYDDRTAEFNLTSASASPAAPGR